jgi:ketosteroid isomerase-like protein
MSRENVEVVVGLFESVNTRDFKRVMDTYADDVVLELHGTLIGLGDEGAVGKEAVGEWFGEWFRTFDRDYRFEIEETRDWGDRVFLVATHHGHGRASGTPVTQSTAYVYEVRDGKVVRCDVWATAAEALEAAGPRK